MLVSGRYISHWTAIPFVVFNESLVLAICSPLNQNSASGLYRDKKNKGCLHSLKNNCSLHSRVQPKNRPEPSSSPTISGVNFWKLKLPKQCINASNLLERITSSKTHRPYFLQGCDWGPEFPFKHSTRITNTWLIRFLQQKKRQHSTRHMNWKALLCSLFIKWVVNITVCKSMLVAAPFMRTQAFAKVIASIVGSPWSSTNILKKVSAFLMSFREKLGKGAKKDEIFETFQSLWSAKVTLILQVGA